MFLSQHSFKKILWRYLLKWSCLFLVVGSSNSNDRTQRLHKRTQTQHSDMAHSCGHWSIHAWSTMLVLFWYPAAFTRLPVLLWGASVCAHVCVCVCAMRVHRADLCECFGDWLSPEASVPEMRLNTEKQTSHFRSQYSFDSSFLDDQMIWLISNISFVRHFMSKMFDD